MLATPGHIDHVAETRLRFATHDDLPAIARLMKRSCANDGIPRIDRQELEAIATRGHLIVLQIQPGELAAAACVATGRGLIFLTIDPEVASVELERRMIGVAEALDESERKPPPRAGEQVAIGPDARGPGGSLTAVIPAGETAC